MHWKMEWISVFHSNGKPLQIIHNGIQEKSICPLLWNESMDEKGSIVYSVVCSYFYIMAQMLYINFVKP